MAYDAFSCDLVVGASDSAVYRFNLDRGQYLAPFETEQPPHLGVNAVARASLHGLYGFGTESGTVEFWDRRDRKRVGILRMVNEEIDSNFEVSSIKFLPDGITWAAGTSTGQVSVFDLRSTKPLYTRDHHYGFPIKEIKYHAASENIISYDKKALRIWNRSTGNLLTTVEMSGGVELNHVNLGAGENGSGDGFLLCSVEDRQMQSFFIPSLGPAPRWASFLENLTEEMEEGTRVGGKASITAGAVYDNYKFVTRAELSTLNLDHLIGTSVLRAYMHGYFVDLRLYEKAKSIANPFAYEEYLEEQRRSKLEAERAGRIKANSSALKPSQNQQQQQKKKGQVVINGVKAKVNTVLAERLQQQSELLAKLDAMEAEKSQQPATEHCSDSESEEEVVMTKAEKKAIQAAKSGQAILADTRFSSLFTNPEFAIDEDTEEFRSIARRTVPDDN
jgi:ribosome biogenesis protein ENP2